MKNNKNIIKNIRETSINTIAVGLVGAGAMLLQNKKFLHGAVLILTGAALEYWKYHLRFLENKIILKS